MFKKVILMGSIALAAGFVSAQGAIPTAETFDDCNQPYTYFYGGDANYTAQTLHIEGDFLYSGGSRGKQAMLAKLTPAGEVVWTQYFEPFLGLDNAVVDIKTDSEGFLIGCGQAKVDGRIKSFAFKMTAADGTILWAKAYGNETTTSFTATHIQEITPDGNYTLLGTADYRIVPEQGCEAVFYPVSRTDGSIAAPGIHYHLGNCDGIAASVVVGNNLYTAGTYSFSNTGVDKLRPAITSITDGGTLVWSRLLLADIFREARLYGTDMQQDGSNGLVLLAHGDDNGVATATEHVWLLYTNLLGNAQFALKFTLPEPVVSRNLIAIDGQYIALATATNSNTSYVIRIANTGEVLWTTQIPGLQIADARQAMAIYGGQLHIVGTHPSGGTTDAALLRVDMATGDVPDCLTHTSLSLTTEAIFDVYDGFNALSPYLSPVTVVNTFTTTAGPLAVLPTSCRPACGTEICDNGIDDDGDDLIDCDDPDVANTCCCLPSPLLQLGADMEVCAGSSVVFAVDGYASYLWSPAEGLDCGTCATVAYTPTATGYLRLVATSEAGCEVSDSVFITVRTPITGTSATATLCPGETIIFGNQAIVASGTYFATRVSGACTATDTLVVVAQPSGTHTAATLCAGETITFGGQTIGVGGTYFAPRTEGLCTLTDTLVVSVAPGGNISAATLCAGETLTFGGQTIGESGTYFTLRDAGLCEVTDTLVVNVLPDASTLETVVVCTGESAIIFGESVTEPGIYSRPFTTPDGCTATESIALENEHFSASAYVFPPCASAPDRSIVYIRTTGNGGPYTVRWNGTLAVNNTINGVPLGDHVAEVTSANGCVYYVPFTIRIYMPWQPLVSVFNTGPAAALATKTASFTQIPLTEAPVIPELDYNTWPVEWTVAPNPMRAQTVFRLNGYTGTIYLDVVDAKGKRIYQTQSQGSEIILRREDLGSSGVYFYYLQTNTAPPIVGRLVVLD